MTDREAEPGPSVVQRADAFQQRHKAAGFPLAVVYKYVDIGGAHLSALITYYGFVSLFPLLLLASTVLGILLNGHPELQQRLLDSAVSRIPVLGQDLSVPGAISGRATGVVVGVLGALYGGIGIALAVQNAANAVWSVPRNSRPNPIKGRLLSVVLLAVIAGDALGTGALAALVGGVHLGGFLPGALIVVGSFLIHAVAFSYVFRLATARDLSRADVRPGALLAATIWLLLQYVGVALATGGITGRSATTGVFAVVLGMLAFLYLTSVMIVLSMTLNVVLAQRLWPRSLLTPFTDNVVLTEADKRSYVGLAKAQRLKGFETVAVEFDEPEPDPDADPDRDTDPEQPRA